MKKLLCPSMMCADCGNLEREVQDLEAAGADIFHIDIMDGNFVPNFGMGLQDIAAICRTARKDVDVHLMIENPERYIKKFADLGAAIIYIHPEAARLPVRALQSIKALGKKAGLVLSPQVAVETIMPLLNMADYVLAMTVNPGFAGQEYLDFADKKIAQLISLAGEYGYRLIIDGACSPEKIKRLGEEGADGFVLGTSALFNKKRPYRDIIRELRIV